MAEGPHKKQSLSKPLNPFWDMLRNFGKLMDVANVVWRVPTEATKQFLWTILVHMMTMILPFPTEKENFTYILNMQDENSLFILHDTTAWDLVTG